MRRACGRAPDRLRLSGLNGGSWESGSLPREDATDTIASARTRCRMQTCLVGSRAVRRVLEAILSWVGERSRCSFNAKSQGCLS